MSSFQQVDTALGHLNGLRRRITDNHEIRKFPKIQSIGRAEYAERQFNINHITIHAEHSRSTVLADTYNPKILCCPIQSYLYGKAYNIRSTKHLLCCLFRYNADLITGIIITGGKIMSCNNRLTLVKFHAFRTAGRIRGKFTFFANCTAVHRIYRGHTLYTRHLLFYCFKVIRVKINLFFTVLIIYINTNQPSGHGIQFIINLSFNPIADGYNHDYGSNTDDNTQHSQD